MSFLEKNKQEKITSFVKFVNDELGLKNCPKIILQNGKGDLKTTANYNYSSDKILAECWESNSGAAG